MKGIEKDNILENRISNFNSNISFLFRNYFK